ncbi:hypothetical protein GCM10027405_39450 [Arthrobacter alkaliphilus]|uniref:DUF1643 domain-containing protein n=1 Tax=Arthrobacter alkaliphilus TaxID=369936 RepID=UPI001F1BE5D7|nr:DUF1643 domain-containing protein [Arthrobacter alkaliphilus]
MAHTKASRGLTAVLFNPPLSTGARTLARVALAAKLLGHQETVIVNLFPLATKSVLEVNTIGVDADLWLSARSDIAERLAVSGDVLLAYGCQEPVGEVRIHFRTQLAWLRQRLHDRGSTIWSVSDQPRHPSRWQRHTARNYPGMPFDEALELSLQQQLLPQPNEAKVSTA